MNITQLTLIEHIPGGVTAAGQRFASQLASTVLDRATIPGRDLGMSHVLHFTDDATEIVPEGVRMANPGDDIVGVLAGIAERDGAELAALPITSTIGHKMGKTEPELIEEIRGLPVGAFALTGTYDNGVRFGFTSTSQSTIPNAVADARQAIQAADTSWKPFHENVVFD